MDSFFCEIFDTTYLYMIKAVKSAKEQKNFAPFERTEI